MAKSSSAAVTKAKSDSVEALYDMLCANSMAGGEDDAN
ncbi:hypothetical protein MY5147_002772 [Beauveria neobassiana]